MRQSKLEVFAVLAAGCLAIAPMAAVAAAAPTYAVIDHIPAADGGWDYLRVDRCCQSYANLSPLIG